MTYERDRVSRVIAIANGKGAVGKTTVAVSLAAAAGYRVLLDLDPQGNLGDLGYLEGGHSGRSGRSREPRRHQRGRGLTDLGGALFGRHSNGGDSTELLAAALAPVAGDYVLVLIDTPPIDAQLQNLAPATARWLLIPT